MTLLSILIPHFNHRHLIEETLASILTDAPLGEFEIILVDDGSTDGSDRLLRHLAERTPSIHLHFHPKNLGIHAALNTAASLAKGEYLHLFSADDLYLPGSTNRLLEMIKRQPEVALFCSGHASFTEPHNIEREPLLDLSTFRLFNSSEVFRLFKKTRFWIAGHTACIKRDIYKQFAPQNPQLKSVSDWYVNHKIALVYGMGYEPEPLFARRKAAHSYSSSASLKEKREMWLYLLRLLEQSDNQPLAATGLCRMLGLKAIYLDLLTTPRYWKLTYPMLRKEIWHILSIGAVREKILTNTERNGGTEAQR